MSYLTKRDFDDNSSDSSFDSELYDHLSAPRITNGRSRRNAALVSPHGERILDVVPEKTYNINRIQAQPSFLLSESCVIITEAILRNHWSAFQTIAPYERLSLANYYKRGNVRRLTVTELIVLAIWQSPEKRLSQKYIYAAVQKAYPLTKQAHEARKNSIRHNLSLKKCFIRMRRPRHYKKKGNSGKGDLWTIDASACRTDCGKRQKKRKSTAKPKNKRVLDEAAMVPQNCDQQYPAPSLELYHSAGHHGGMDAHPTAYPSAPPHASGEYPVYTGYYAHSEVAAGTEAAYYNPLTGQGFYSTHTYNPGGYYTAPPPYYPHGHEYPRDSFYRYPGALNAGEYEPSSEGSSTRSSRSQYNRYSPY